MPKSASKLLVVGIDAANPALLLRWAEEGILPNIRSLLERGILGKTRSVEGFFVGSTWPSLYTGVTPARHGFHYLSQLKPGTYEFFRQAEEGIVKSDAFWSRLSQAGRRVAVLDVPLSRIDPSLNGIQVVEWGAHDSVYGFRTSPPHLTETIKSRFGVHPLSSSCDGIRTTPRDYGRFVDALIEGVQAKGELTKYFLQQGGWDFFMQVFTESHCVGHQCWHLHDTTHPAHDPSIVAAIGDPLRRVYTSIDRAVGEILHEAGDTLIVLLVAHGMSYWYGAQFLLPEILCRLGVTKLLAATSASGSVVSMSVEGAKRAWRCLPVNLRQQVARLRRRLQPTVTRNRLPTIGIEPESSICFPYNNGLGVGGIRLNLAGREPQGILEPNAVDEFCNELSDDLLSIVDQRTCKPLVRRVLRTADLYTGEFLDHLPDLLVEWNDIIPTGSTVVGHGAGAAVRCHSPKIGTIEGVNEYGRTGEHRLEGLFIAAGPGVCPGVIQRDISILDFAPTFARILDVDLHDCDGHPIVELL